MYDLGRVTGYIRINANQALAAYGKTRAAHAQTMSALERSAMTTKRIGLAFATVGGAALAGFGMAVKASADFEKRMSFVQALTKATPPQMDKLRNSMFKLSQQFGVSTNDVADAYIELAKAGARIDQIAGGMGKATITLARSADISAADAAKNIVGISATFEKGARSAMHVADLLQGGANAAIIDVSDMAFAMKYAGSTAHTFGISLGDLTDVVTILGQANIRGSQAGTSLRRMMIQMTAPTKTAYAALKALGIITKDGANQFFDAQGKMRPFQDNINILRQSLKHLSPQQRISALNTIFGSRAIAAANVLLKTSNKEWNRFHGEIRKGSAEGIARKRLDNLAGAWAKFKAALDVALVRAGAPAQRPLMQLVGFLTRMVKAFGKLSPHTQQFIVKLVLLTGVLFTLAGAFMLTVSFLFRLMQTFLMVKEMVAFIKALRIVQILLVNLRAAFWLLGRAMMSLFLNPVGLVILAVAALGIAAYELYKHWAPFRNLINTIGKGFIWLGKTIVGGLISAFHWIQHNGAKIAAGLILALAPFFPFVALGIAILYEFIHNWKAIWGAAKAIFGAFIAIFKPWWGLAMAIAKRAWKYISAVTMGQLRAMIDIVKGAVGVLKAVWHVAWTIMKGVVKLAWDLIKNVVMAGVHFVVGVVKIIADILDGKWRKAWHDAGQLVWTAIKDIWKILSHFTTDAAKLLWNAGKAIIQGLVGGIKSLAMAPVHAVTDIAKGIYHGVTGFFRIGSPSRLMADAGYHVSEGLAVGIIAGKGKVQAAMQSIANQVVSNLNTIGQGISDFINTWGGSSGKYAGMTGAQGAYAFKEGQQKAAKKIYKKQHPFSFHMPNIDLGGADYGADFSGGGDITGSGSKKKKGSKAKQRRVDLTLLFQSGKWIMDGFRKGMESGRKGVKTFLNDLDKRILSYMNKAKHYGDKAGLAALKKLKRQVDDYGDHLMRLAERRDKWLKKIEAQQKHLDDLLKAKHDYAKSVADSIRDLGNITQVVTKVDASGNPDVTNDNIVAGLQNTLAATKEYYDELAKLRKMGLNKRTYDQLVQAGPEAGGPYVRALLDGGKDTVTQVNSLTKQINDEAVKVGKQTSNAMYNQGIETAKGFIKGWREHASKLYQAMRDVAKEMVRTIKKELGIKSPSTVMMDLGAFTTQGYAMGLMAEVKRVQDAARKLGIAARPDVSSLSTRAAGVSGASLRVSAELPDGYKGRDVNLTQNIKSTEPKKAADESARKLRTAAQMGVFD